MTPKFLSEMASQWKTTLMGLELFGWIIFYLNRETDTVIPWYAVVPMAMFATWLVLADDGRVFAKRALQAIKIGGQAAGEIGKIRNVGIVTTTETVVTEQPASPLPPAPDEPA